MTRAQRVSILACLCLALVLVLPAVGGGADEDFSWRPVSPALRTVLVGLGVVAALCLAWIASLRRGIDRKTRALRKSEADLREAYRQSAQQEELYRSLLRSIPDPVALYELDGAAVYVNPSFSEVFGFSLDEVRERRIPFVPPEETERTLIEIRRVLGGEACRGFETRRLTRDGRTLDIILSSSVYHDHEGKPAGIVVVLRDVTARKRAEEERAALEVQLRHAQKMEAIGTLAGGIAHDFNNILSAIVGYADLSLLSLPPADPERGNLEGILRAAYRARDLVQQILAFSRPSATGCGPLDPSVPVREALRLLRATLPSTIEMKERVTSPAPSVVADPTELHQVVMNLCTNASHAMRERGGLLEVALDVVERRVGPSSGISRLAPCRCVRLVVRDTGDGMDEETRRRAFEPYFTTKQVGEGSGLGLAVVHGIVARRGGEVRLESGRGRGTCVEIVLPAADEPPEPAGPEERRAPTLPRGGERVLVVDDEPSVAEVSARMLASLGYRTEVAGSGAEALERFRADPEGFDLVVTDQTLPQMTGAALAEALLAARPGLPILLCTGYSDQLDEEKARRIGARALLYKPLDRRKLATAVREALDSA